MTANRIVDACRITKFGGFASLKYDAMNLLKATIALAKISELNDKNLVAASNRNRGPRTPHFRLSSLKCGPA